MKTLVVIYTIVLVGMAQAQTSRTYSDSMGRNIGRSTTQNSNTTFYDAMGRNTGRASTQSNGTTTFYDNMGRMTGRSK